MADIRRLEKIGDTYFPVEYCDNGMVIIDYPRYDPIMAKKITEAGRENIKKLDAMFSELKKEFNFTIQLGNTDGTQEKS